MPQIPERWLLYSPVGEPIAGTKLISFKVPLKDALCKRLKENERFTPEMLMERCPKLGLVIDLTFTTRYYNWEVFTSNGVQYKKIPCPGLVIPPDKLLTEFFNTVDAFLDETSGRDLLVGVHCTHGVNRTGYFMCRYMTLRMGIEPQKAIYAFEKARGHKMERQPYIQVILSGKSLEDGKIMQHNRTEWGDRHSRSGPTHPNTRWKRTREHSPEHYPAFSQPPPLLRRRPDSRVPEYPLTNLHNGYVSISSTISLGPSISGGNRNRSADYQGRSPHQSYSRSNRRPKNNNYTPFRQLSPLYHPDQSKSPSATSRDAGPFGSNSATSDLVSARSFNPSTLLNPRSEHSREHRPAFSQSPSLRQKHPSSIHLVSPLADLYNECVSSSSYIHCGPPKNDGTGKRSVGYPSYSLDHGYQTYNSYNKRKYSKP